MRPLILLLAITGFSRSGSAQVPDSALIAADQWIRHRAEADSFSGAVLIAKNGVPLPLLRRGYGLANRETRSPVTPATKFNLGSIDKLIPALPSGSSWPPASSTSMHPSAATSPTTLTPPCKIA